MQYNNLYPLTYFNTNSFWSISLRLTVDKTYSCKASQTQVPILPSTCGKTEVAKNGEGQSQDKPGSPYYSRDLLTVPYCCFYCLLSSLLPSLLSDNGYGTYLFTSLLLFFFSVIYITLNPKQGFNLHGKDQLFRQRTICAQFVLTRYL